MKISASRGAFDFPRLLCIPDGFDHAFRSNPSGIRNWQLTFMVDTG